MGSRCRRVGERARIRITRQDASRRHAAACQADIAAPALSVHWHLAALLPYSYGGAMKLRYLASSIAAVAALSAGPALAQDVGTYPPAPIPDSVVVVDPPAVVVITPPTADPLASQADVARQRDILTEPGGMTPQERIDTAGQVDPATGTITAPGYHGPRSSKGQ
jgi:hypothetical protein